MSLHRTHLEQLVETERMLIEASRRLSQVPAFQHAAQHFVTQVGLNRTARYEVGSPIDAVEPERYPGGHAKEEEIPSP